MSMNCKIICGANKKLFAILAIFLSLALIYSIYQELLGTGINKSIYYRVYGIFLYIFYYLWFPVAIAWCVKRVIKSEPIITIEGRELKFGAAKIIQLNEISDIYAGLRGPFKCIIFKLKNDDNFCIYGFVLDKPVDCVIKLIEDQISFNGQDCDAGAPN